MTVIIRFSSRWNQKTTNPFNTGSTRGRILINLRRWVEISGTRNTTPLAVFDQIKARPEMVRVFLLKAASWPSTMGRISKLMYRRPWLRCENPRQGTTTRALVKRFRSNWLRRILVFATLKIKRIAPYLPRMLWKVSRQVQLKLSIWSGSLSCRKVVRFRILIICSEPTRKSNTFRARNPSLITSKTLYTFLKDPTTEIYYD